MRTMRVIVENGFAAIPDAGQELEKCIDMYFDEDQQEKLLNMESVVVMPHNVQFKHSVAPGLHGFIVGIELNEDQVYELQMKLGYHPHGYGVYGITHKDGKTHWFCQTSCD